MSAPLPHPFASPYPHYTIDGELWAAVTGGTLLHANLLHHVVYEPPGDDAATFRPDAEQAVQLVRHHRAHPHATRVLQYVRAHPFADVEVYRDADDAEVCVGTRWARALASCDRLTRGPGDHPVLGWRYVAGETILRAVVAPSVLPVAHGWVRLDVQDRLAVLRKRTASKGRPSPRHKLRVAEYLDHPWLDNVRAVRLAWVCWDTELLEWKEDRRAEVVWPFSEPVVGVGDLRALPGQRV